MRFDLIYADPAWDFQTFSEKGKDRSAGRHYRTSALDYMKAFPVQEIAADNSIMLMWSTYPHLAQSLELGAAWGFEYKTVAFTWVKQNRVGDGFFMGNGYYTRANPEPCLLFRRGKGIAGRASMSVRNLVIDRVREHSRKPDCIYDRIDQLFGAPLRKVELFARNTRDGWTSLGNEIDGMDLMGSIAKVAKE